MNCRTSSYAPRFLAIVAFAAVVVSLSSVPAQAQILNFTQGFNTGQLCSPGNLTNGCLITVTAGDSTNNAGITSGVPSVPVESSVLQLTQNLQSQRGAAWFNTQQPIAGGFGVEFQFQITPTPGNTGDGFAFVIQNSGSGLAAIGGFGGGIGYGTREYDPCAAGLTVAQYSALSASQAPYDSSGCAAGSDVGIPKSVAIEFDTYPNNYDLDSNHVAIQSCGTGDNLADHSSPCLIARSGALPVTLADGYPHYAQIVYLPYTATCPTASPCPNLSVYIDAASHPAPVVQAHVDLNNPCTAAGCPAGSILNNGSAWVGFTAATKGAQEEADILNFAFSPSITLPLKGSGVTNAFVFPFATYDVTYPADVPISNTSMTITPTVLSQTECNGRVNTFGPNNVPTCTIFPVGSMQSVIFDVACAATANQTQGELCPTTSGFNPLLPASTFHNGEDISNIVSFPNASIPPGVAPQFLTAPEGSNVWVAIGVGFSSDLTKGGGTNNYNSQMVLADFPLDENNQSPYLVSYTFAGFTPPVVNQGNNVVNVVKAGQTIPLKWTLNYPTCPSTNPSCGFNGGPVTNAFLAPAGFVNVLTNGCSTSGGGTMNDVSVDDQSNTGLVNNGNGSYQFNWKTPKSDAGQCLTVSVSVGDGVQHNADFQFK